MSIELLFQELCDKVEWDEELKYYFVAELNGSYHVELLTSKSGIAPMKAQTCQVRGFVSKNFTKVDEHSYGSFRTQSSSL